MAKKAEQLEFRGLSKLTKDGSEILDPTPVEVPVGFQKPETVQELVRRLVLDPRIREELSARDAETFDEADDFDVEDDIPLSSPFEETFDPAHIVAREQELNNGIVRGPSDEEKAAWAALKAQKPPVHDVPVKPDEKKP